MASLALTTILPSIVFSHNAKDSNLHIIEATQTIVAFSFSLSRPQNLLSFAIIINVSVCATAAQSIILSTVSFASKPFFSLAEKFKLLSGLRCEVDDCRGKSEKKMEAKQIVNTFQVSI